MLALLGGGGLAVAHDRGTLRAYRSVDPKQRGDHLRELAAVHRLAGTALGASVVTGTVLFFINVERYIGSAVFWLKMALVVGLAANAVVMQLAERDLREGNSEGASGGWDRLRGTALASTTLWIAVVVAGVTVGRLH